LTFDFYLLAVLVSASENLFPDGLLLIALVRTSLMIGGIDNGVSAPGDTEDLFFSSVEFDRGEDGGSVGLDGIGVTGDAVDAASGNCAPAVSDLVGIVC